MMLCAADFDELFPPTSKPDASCVHGSPPPPSAPRIAWWKDDSRLWPAGDGMPVHRAAFSGYELADPRAVGLAFALMPVAAAYGAASAMLATVSGMSRG